MPTARANTEGKENMSANAITSALSVANFNPGNLKVVLKENGAQSGSLLSKKEYGQKHGLKGAELNRQHFEYKKAAMSENAKLVGAALITGDIGITRIATNAKRDGGSVSFKLMSALKAPKTKADKVDLSKLNISDIMSFLEGQGYEVAVAEDTK
jgi:hypothetical protein